MTTTNFDVALLTFDAAIARATTADAAFGALQVLAGAVVGAKLFTVMQVDMAAEVSRRAYTSDPVSYPVSGTKPINRTFWFDIIHTERRYFVANTLDDIAKVFPDHALIGSLGCASVVNMPIILGDALVGTVNLLDGEHHFTPARVALIERYLSLPAKTAMLVALRSSAA